ncbi:MAG: hypothetical protein OEW12_03680 [Deltaproteobacteria bacterium]|nr:hypothetical protein [Deltaproteobacteria bacterium]
MALIWLGSGWGFSVWAQESPPADGKWQTRLIQPEPLPPDQADGASQSAANEKPFNKKSEPQPDEVGVNVSTRDRARRHTDTDKLESVFKSRRFQLNWKAFFNPVWAVSVSGEEEQWRLQGEDGTQYISINFQKIIPKLHYQGEDVSAEAGAVGLGVQKNEALYTQVDTEKKTSFLYPYGKARIILGRFFLEGVTWGEMDIQTLDFWSYTPVAFQTVKGGGGFLFTPDQSLRADVAKVDRVYPGDFPLKRTDTSLEYRMEKPLGDWGQGWWSLFSTDYVVQSYSEAARDNKIFSVFNVFTFNTGGFTHFVDYKLSWVNTVTVYQRGAWVHSLVETYLEEPDIHQDAGYAVFTRLGETGFYITLNARAIDSLKVKAFEDRQYGLKLSYNY